MNVKVLDIKSRIFCWKQCTPAICRKVPKLLPRVMERCIYKRGHDGGHSWEDGKKPQRGWSELERDFIAFCDLLNNSE